MNETMDIVPQNTRRGRKRKKTDDEEEQIIHVYGNKETPLVYRKSSSVLPARPLEVAFEPVAAPGVITKETAPIIKEEIVENDVSTTSMPVNSDLTNIKYEPRSRSFSTETVLADESQDLSSTEYQCDKTSESNDKMLLEISELVKKIKFETQCSVEHDTTKDVFSNSYKADLIYNPLQENRISLNNESQMEFEIASTSVEENAINLRKICHNRSDPTTSVATNSSEAEVMSNVPLSQEVANSSFVSTTPSSNVCLSKPRDITMQMSTGNISFETKLNKYFDFNTEIIKDDVKNCLNYLNSVYPSTKRFNLFFIDDAFLGQSENAVIDPVNSSPTDSSIFSELISTDMLKKIIQATALSLSKLSLPLQNNLENNIVKDTKNIDTPSACGIISHFTTLSTPVKNQNIMSQQTLAENIPIKVASPVVSSAVSHQVTTNDKRSSEETTAEMNDLPKKIENQSVISDQHFNQNIRIKDEPVDDCNESSTVSLSSVTHHVSTSDRRSAEEITTETRDLTKTIKNQSDISDQNSNKNIRIKDEPVDDYDEPTVIHHQSAGEKRSTEETVTEIHALRKKTKVSSDHSLSTTGYNFDSQINLCDRTEKCDSTNKSSKDVQNDQTLEVTHNTLKPLSRALTPQTSCSHKNTVSDTEKIFMSPSKGIPYMGQSGGANNLIVNSHQLFNPKIQVETDSLHDNKTSNVSSVFQRSSTTGGRSEEIVNNMNQAAKINTVAKPPDYSVASVAGNAITTSNVSRNSSVMPQSVLCVKNTVLINNTLQDNANMSYASSVCDTTKNIATASESITSKLPTYSHLVPQDTQKEVSSSDKTPNTSAKVNISFTEILTGEKTKVSSDHSTSGYNFDNQIKHCDRTEKCDSTNKSSNDVQSSQTFEVEHNTLKTSSRALTPQNSCSHKNTVSDTEKNFMSPSKGIPYMGQSGGANNLIVKSHQLFNPKIQVETDSLYDSETSNVSSDTQHVENTSLDRTPSHVNKKSFSRINPQPSIISPNNETTRKKISAEKYLQRKSSLSRDPRLQKGISRNSVSQISSTDNSFPVFVQQNSFQNYVSSQKICMATTSQTPQRSIAPAHIQNKIMAENSNSSQNTPPRSALLKNTLSDPRNPRPKSYYQKLFGSHKGRNDFSTILSNDTVSNNFIETKDLPYLILSWDVSWLATQKKVSLCPPICDNYLRVKDTYQCVQDYYDTYLPLHLLNIWFTMYNSWETSKVLYDGTCYDVTKGKKLWKISCTVVLSEADKINWPKTDDIIICSTSNTPKFFGRIFSIFEHNYYPMPDFTYSQNPCVWKKLYLEITCVENFTAQLPVSVQMQNLINVSTALKQNDALKYMNPSMRALILNPRQNEKLIQTVSMPPITNAITAIRTLKHRITIVNTPSFGNSVYAILQIVSLKIHPLSLISVKDEKTFFDLAEKLKNHNMILAIKEDDIPQLPLDLRRFTVEHCNIETLRSCRVVLTLISSMFFGQIESRLTTEPIICIIHEAQFFFETETALLLTYNVKHLILTGRPKVRACTSPILCRYLFNVSLFHRISGEV